MDDIKKLTQEIVQFSEERDWDQFHSPVNLAMKRCADISKIYATLMMRGIRGALVYVCDPDLREYLRMYFNAEA